MVYVLMTDEYEIYDGSVVNEWQEITLFSNKADAHKAMMDAISAKVSAIYKLMFEGEFIIKNMTNIAVSTNGASVEFEYEDSTQNFRCTIFEKEIQ
ncbi:MAG: hypothetical protein IKG14_00435 [Clostridia bacterium]|nr:hypothetical protein [Clostridia bacterium]